ncbi:PadR family transcriptional regulator [Alkaliphilus serpentinus]|uniref:PadR family transcriptional regulator n=1 Tax=Alkaliphilus serpentinus TaxID=1482731 RepID=A0A833M8T1_9FIRM|nr:PadR family transcriptional regulator [Alkaliphilus serpentinus]KAB3531546.1 PadR family transcriptional regulator [Alkaliphilus serpentinus]
MLDMEAIIQNLQQEMNRGTLVLAVLTQMDQQQYGYSLIQALNDEGIMVEQNTLYPLLRRIEKQGLLESIWQVEGNRPRRYYKISELGIKVRKELIKEWKLLEKSMANLIGGEV